MAARFWLGTTSTAWGTAANWSTTSGGAGGAAVPTNADDVTFDSAGNNPCITQTTDRVCKTLTFTTGYTNTFTITVGSFLSVSGSITIVSGFTFSNVGGTNTGLRMIAAGTWTTNGVTVPGPVFIGNTTSFTCTLADALTIGGLLSLTNTTSTTFSGAFTITAGSALISGSQTVTLSGNVVINGLTTHSSANVLDGAFNWSTVGMHQNAGCSLSGTATIVMIGTGGTWDVADNGGTLANSLTFNCTTLTISGTLYYLGGTITYTAGTITTTSTTLSIGASTTMNTAGMTWASIILTAALTLTLNSLLTLSGTLTGPNAALTFAGTSGFTVATLTNTSLTATRIWTFAATETYTVTGAFTTVGGEAGGTTRRFTWASSSPGTPVNFVLAVTASQDVGFVDPTDIDASGGIPIFTYHGVITTSPNWINQYPGGGGAGVHVFAYAS